MPLFAHLSKDLVSATLTGVPSLSNQSLAHSHGVGFVASYTRLQFREGRLFGRPNPDPGNASAFSSALGGRQFQDARAWLILREATFIQPPLFGRGGHKAQGKWQPPAG